MDGQGIPSCSNGESCLLISNPGLFRCQKKDSELDFASTARTSASYKSVGRILCPFPRVRYSDSIHSYSLEVLAHSSSEQGWTGARVPALMLSDCTHVRIQARDRKEHEIKIRCFLEGHQNFE